ncbi:unnamed protein product [Lactuca virosa]|uniref:Uncharacterized protein n=1 Tax=Lactuca virosa TaxID=75947 RepID=A0AAU9NCN0_9ASTR|nr:unnamed protein product [Lactuca virosa]
MPITAVTIVNDSGGSSLLVGTCRSGTENHRSNGGNRGSETENVDLESFGAYISDGSGWPVFASSQFVVNNRSPKPFYRLRLLQILIIGIYTQGLYSRCLMYLLLGHVYLTMIDI